MKKKQIKHILVILLIVAVTAAIAAVIVMEGLPEGIQLPAIFQTSAQTNGQTEISTDGISAESRPVQEETTPRTEPVTEIDTIEFPIVLEDGKLEIESLFAYSGLNPDDDNAEVKNAAAITLVNKSGEYLSEARITLVLDSGDTAVFEVTDVPAGRRVIAFSTNSVKAHEHIGCTEAACEAVFDAAATMQEEKISVSVEGMTVNVQNLTGNEIRNIVIYCRCPLGDEFFGGITYQYPINSLPANGSTTVEAWDCVLGMAEVVRIEINE